MNLFGCKFRKMEKIDGKEVEVRARKNFDSLLWSTVTVFQVRSKTFDHVIRLTLSFPNLIYHVFDVLGEEKKSYTIGMLSKIGNANLNIEITL